MDSSSSSSSEDWTEFLRPPLLPGGPHLYEFVDISEKSTRCRDALSDNYSSGPSSEPDVSSAPEVVKKNANTGKGGEKFNNEDGDSCSVNLPTLKPKQSPKHLLKENGVVGNMSQGEVDTTSLPNKITYGRKKLLKIGLESIPSDSLKSNESIFKAANNKFENPPTSRKVGEHEGNDQSGLKISKKSIMKDAECQTIITGDVISLNLHHTNVSGDKELTVKDVTPSHEKNINLEDFTTLENIGCYIASLQNSLLTCINGDGIDNISNQIDQECIQGSNLVVSINDESRSSVDTIDIISKNQVKQECVQDDNLVICVNDEGRSTIESIHNSSNNQIKQECIQENNNLVMCINDVGMNSTESVDTLSNTQIEDDCSQGSNLVTFINDEDRSIIGLSTDQIGQECIEGNDLTVYVNGESIGNIFNNQIDLKYTYGIDHFSTNQLQQSEHASLNINYILFSYIMIAVIAQLFRSLFLFMYNILNQH